LLTGGDRLKGRFLDDFKTTPEMLDEISYKSIMIGFPLLTLGIITGAVWANEAWGTYWGWDPKETWSLITWFIYAAYLHARYTRGWSGKRAASISIFGFLAVIFTYLGVNLLLSGLHAYASAGGVGIKDLSQVVFILTFF
jgi:cytochrome c-type biogenesis protein CcsB